MDHLFGFEDWNLNESKKTVKRRYTENYPAKNMYSGARVRKAIFDAVGDGTITEEEIQKILTELGADLRWHKRNKQFFDVSEDGTYCLSARGKYVNTKVHESKEEDEAYDILQDLLGEWDPMDLEMMDMDQAMDTVDSYGHKGSKAKKIAQYLFKMAQSGQFESNNN